MRPFLVIAVWAFLCIPGAVYAAEGAMVRHARPFLRYADADECAGQSLHDCFKQEYENSQSRLDEILSKLSARKNPKNLELLNNAQNLWDRYRTAECYFETGLRSPAAIYPMAYYVCLKEKTDVRIRELEYQLNCGRDDPVCNGYHD